MDHQDTPHAILKYNNNNYYYTTKPLINKITTGLISRRNNFANFAFGSNSQTFFTQNL